MLKEISFGSGWKARLNAHARQALNCRESELLITKKYHYGR